MATAVMADTRRTKMIMAYLGTVAVLGAATIAVTVLADLGFFGYLVGGILLLAGVAGLGGLRASGGAWTAACPSCGATMTSGELGDELKQKDAKVVCCPKCGVYARGTEALEVVEAGYVHPSPVFEAPLPERFAWTAGCQACGAHATRTVRVEGRSFAGQMAGVVGGVAMVSSVDVPVCDAHTFEPVWLVRKPGGTVISFRAIELWRRFRAQNG
jgi:hypothetical protein